MPLHVSEPRDALAYAEAYRSTGYGRCIPLAHGTKKPPLVPWKEFQSRDPTIEEYRGWFGDQERNLALVVPENLVVVDCDAAEMLELVLKHCGVTPMISQTPRGGAHAYYRRRKGVDLSNQVRVKGRAVDFRVCGSYVVEKPSVDRNGTPYLWTGDVLPVEDLPILKVRWLRDYAKQNRKMMGDVVKDDHEGRLRRAQAYVACIEGATSGQGGHRQTMRVAGILVQRFGLAVEEALPIFEQWNETCEPPWSRQELLHKLEDADRLRDKFKPGK